MMDLFSVLSSLNIPFCHVPYTGTADTFLAYTLINHTRSNWASGGGWQDETNVSVDLYSRGPYESIAEQVIDLLRDAGCAVSYGAEVYEDDTGYHHVNIDVTYWEDVGIYASSE